MAPPPPAGIMQFGTSNGGRTVACRTHSLLKVLVLALVSPVVLLTGCDSPSPPSKEGPTAAAVPADAPARSAKPAAPPGELHVVSIQRGSYPPGTDDRPWWAKCKDDPSMSDSECHKKFASLRTKGQTEVAVTYTAAPVVLALLGSDPVEWTIDVAPGVVLQKVILAGQYRQELKGLPPRVPVEVYNRESYGCETCTQAGPGFHGYDPNSGEYRQAMQRLRTVAGQLPASLQASAEGNRFTVSATVKPYSELPPEYRAWETP